MPLAHPEALLSILSCCVLFPSHSLSTPPEAPWWGRRGASAFFGPFLLFPEDSVGWCSPGNYRAKGAVAQEQARECFRQLQNQDMTPIALLSPKDCYWPPQLRFQGEWLLV